MTLNSNMSPDIFPLEQIKEYSSKVNPREMSPIPLAFIGDAVYEVMIRSYLLSLAEPKVDTLHRQATCFANAAFQAQMTEKLFPLLSEEEAAVYKRGRNANPGHTPKNKSEAQYHKATGFEALFGYLYLMNRFDRLKELFLIITQEKVL